MRVWVIQFEHQHDGRPVYWRGRQNSDLDYTGDVGGALKFTSRDAADLARTDLGGAGIVVEVEV